MSANANKRNDTPACGVAGRKMLLYLRSNTYAMSKEYSSTPDQDRGLVVEPAKPELKQPPLYKVILLNDDYTPMEFVVRILERFFGMNQEKATQVMLHVHTRGQGVCGVFTHEIAETKVVQVNEFSRRHQHPLLCTMEEA